MEPKVLDWEAPKALLEYSASSRQRFFEIILYQVILNRSDLSLHWKSFFEQFKDCIDSGIVELSFLFQIREFLGKACNGNWSKMSSYISPLHFAYLLERFLYLISSSKSICFTTKSSLLETLTCENWKPNSKSESDTDASLKDELYSLQPFLVEFSYLTLINEKSTLKWFEKTDAAAKKDYPSLVLRLTILACLVCINAEDHFGRLCDILLKDDASSFLPLEFREILGLAKPSNNFYERVSSENPLVILYSGKNRPTFSCRDAIFIDMELVSCREDILDILYLNRTECVQQNAAIELETKCLGDNNVASGNIGSMIRCSQPSSSSGEEEQSMENEHDHDICLQEGYMMVLRADDGPGFAMNPLALKFNVEKLIGVLDAAIAKSNLNASSVAEDHRFITEAEITLGELKQLLTALRRRGFPAHPFKICHTY
ncbi:hypothetical protein MKW94_004944 [Papaver nudicaule]|uniref:Uncharacterized protein n=1 Tax=Papaver nudicaule TaxID=74823 RepID=A0AA41VIF2_PAPNU|nr:hypothetical protein [Papaver nudicaule]